MRIEYSSCTTCSSNRPQQDDDHHRLDSRCPLQLSLFGGVLDVKLTATFEQSEPPPASSAVALRVAFRNIQFSLLGARLPPIKFPEGTERTWLLTYTDADTRLVRAGVDGGRSTARDLGLLEQSEGEAADAYLFVLTRAAEDDLAPAATSASNPLAVASRRRALKAQLLEACDAAGGQQLGAGADTEGVALVESLMDEIAALNPTPNPASSPLLCSTWDIRWTTESELLGLTSNGALRADAAAALEPAALDLATWILLYPGPCCSSPGLGVPTRQVWLLLCCCTETVAKRYAVVTHKMTVNYALPFAHMLGLALAGFFGLPCSAAYQKIQREKSGGEGAEWAYTLANNIDFDAEDGGGDEASSGFLRVGSTCEPQPTGGRVNFRFERCAAKWKQFEVPLPPVGAGYFEVLYMDDEVSAADGRRSNAPVGRRPLEAIALTAGTPPLRFANAPRRQTAPRVQRLAW